MKIQPTGIDEIDALAWRLKDPGDGYPRWSAFIGKRHPFATKSGQQWRSRLVASVQLERRLLPSEHVHHLNGDRLNDQASNLEVVLAEFHGSIHAYLTRLTWFKNGHLRELSQPGPTWPGHRYCAIISGRKIENGFS